MPAEDLEHEGLAKNPNLALAQLKFQLTLPNYKGNAEIEDQIMEAIKADGMIFFIYNFILVED